MKWTLRWLTAVALVGSLYAHTLFNSDQAATTRTMAFVIAALLSISTALWFMRPSFLPPATVSRQWGLMMVTAAVLIWIVISVYHLLNGEMHIKDFGQFGIYCGVPIFLFLNTDRAKTANAIGAVCVAFALADLVFNIGVIFRVFQPVAVSGFAINGQFHDRYPGLSGGVLGAGLVALIASAFSASRLRAATSVRSRLFWLAVLVGVFAGMIAVESRRYLVEAIAAIFLLLTSFPNRLTLPFVPTAIGGFGLYETFHSFEIGDRIRQALMIAGWQDVQQNFWVGAGILYRQASLDATGVFASLWKDRVTESGFLDLGLAFGAPATILFMVGVSVALCARRNHASWYAVIVAVMLGEFAYGLPLGGFLGAAVFYAALLVVLLDERPAVEVEPARITSLIPSPA